MTVSVSVTVSVTVIVRFPSNTIDDTTSYDKEVMFCNKLLIMMERPFQDALKATVRVRVNLCQRPGRGYVTFIMLFLG